MLRWERYETLLCCETDRSNGGATGTESDKSILLEQHRGSRLSCLWVSLSLAQTLVSLYRSRVESLVAGRLPLSKSMTFVDVDLVVFLRLCQGIFTLCRDKKMMQKKSSADVTQKPPEECKTQKPTLDTAEGHNDGRGREAVAVLSPLLLGGEALAADPGSRIVG